MHKYRFFSLGVLLLVWQVFAESQDSLNSKGKLPSTTFVKPEDTLRTIQHAAFSEGERLVFDVGYSFFTAAEAVFSVSSADSVRGRECSQILFTVNTTPSFSWIFKVDDRYESILDKKGVFPWRFSQRIREGKYSRDFSAELDQVHSVATTPEGPHPIPPYVHDVVSAFYYTRVMDFSNMRPGQRTYLQNFYKDTTYSLAVKFLGHQRLTVDAGTFDCIIVEPLIKEGGLFKSEGRVLLWLTNDEKKIPVKVSTKVVIGSIDAELREYYGVIGPIKAKVN